MYKVNLIKGWQKTEAYKLYRNRIVLFLAILAVVLIVVYLVAIIKFIMLQRELSELSNRQFFATESQAYSTETLTKTIYSLKKMEQIKNVYLGYPDYYRYHEFLLKKILKYKSFSLDRYELNKQHQLNVTIRSDNLDDIFAIVADLESPGTSKYFSAFEIANISQNKDRNSEEVYFIAEFSLQFNNLILNEAI